jgi:O-antigen/teichoic acid export membrane protein
MSQQEVADDIVRVTTGARGMRRDLASAYGASLAKVGSWLWVTGFLFRMWGEEAVAVFALARATLGVFAYATFGIGPAMIHFLARAAAPRKAEPVAEPGDERPRSATDVVTLDYRVPTPRRPFLRPADEVTTTYANGLLLAAVFVVVGVPAGFVFGELFPSLFHLPDPPRAYVIKQFVAGMACGLVFRLASDTPGAVIQVRGLVWLDNLILIAGEIVWVLLVWQTKETMRLQYSHLLIGVGGAYATSGGLVMLARFLAAAMLNGLAPRHAAIRIDRMRSLLAFGSVVMVGQLADFLYAPVDFILINHLLGPTVAATYLPAVQVDAGLLLLVTALAAVVLPRAAVAHAGGDVASLRAYYVRGTLASLALLAAAALVVWVLSPWLFRLWLADDMVATRAILPLVLVHTVVGGSSAVGRSILLGMGRVKPFTIAVLVAGLANVALSYIFVAHLGLGLNGIVLGTIVAVVGRCAIWQPWYVMRCLRETATTTRVSRETSG